MGSQWVCSSWQEIEPLPPSASFQRNANIATTNTGHPSGPPKRGDFQFIFALFSSMSSVVLTYPSLPATNYHSCLEKEQSRPPSSSQDPSSKSSLSLPPILDQSLSLILPASGQWEWAGRGEEAFLFILHNCSFGSHTVYQKPSKRFPLGSSPFLGNI
jgi:hypothetical protein